MAEHKQIFNVDFNYPVAFCRGIFQPENPLLRDTLNRLDENRRHRAIVYIDEGVAAENPALADDIRNYFNAHPDQLELVADPEVVPGGEQIKNNYRLIMGVLDQLLEYKLCRQSYVIAIGGGAVQDAIGFAAAIVHRGLRMIRMNTTVLAQNDAGVGVKNSMNLHGAKNSIGTFAPPFAVINDYDFLNSLSFTDWVGGVSEAFKVAIIKDPAFFDQLCAMAPAIKRRDIPSMERLIERCAIMHLDHIRTNGDAFELGTARPLDFGHWAAHKLEGMSNFKISHGHAVAAGICIDSYYAMKKGWITEADYTAIETGLHESGYTLWYPEIDRRLGDGSLELLGGLAAFQEHLGGELCITMPDGIGAKMEVHEMDEPLIAEAVQHLKDTFSHAVGENQPS
ncbi:MAG: 3-dehydroquinate synthase [Kiritimatiellia bacterium]|jgi:3-dehydroquinate synthase